MTRRRNQNANDVYDQVVDSQENEIEFWLTEGDDKLTITVNGIRVPKGMLQFDHEEMIPFKYFDYCEVEVTDNSSKKKVAIPFIIALVLALLSVLINVLALNAITLLFIVIGIIVLIRHEARELRETKIEFHIGETSQSVRVEGDIENEFRTVLAKATRHKMKEKENRVR